MGEHAMQCKGGVFYGQPDARAADRLLARTGRHRSARPEHGQSDRRGADAVALARVRAAALNARNAAAHRNRRHTPGRDLFRIRLRRAALYHGRFGKTASTLWGRKTLIDSLQWREAAGRCKMVRTREWKYVHDPMGDRDELYDLVADPNELVNVIDEEQHRDALAAMRLRLADWSIDTEDGQPVPLPDRTHYELT